MQSLISIIKDAKKKLVLPHLNLHDGSVCLNTYYDLYSYNTIVFILKELCVLLYNVLYRMLNSKICLIFCKYVKYKIYKPILQYYGWY